MRPKQILTELAVYLNALLAMAAHPESGWTAPRRVFAHRLLVGLVMAGDVMLSSIVRTFPSSTAIKHRYKGADRMLGKVDLVPVAGHQVDVLGAHVGPDYVVAIDLSDIHKKYGKAMEALALVRDGSTGEVAVPGYGLVSATAFDMRAGHKAMPLPLIFETYSSVSEEFLSETAIWLDAIDRVCDATEHGVIAIDRAGDNRRILRRLVDRKRDFVVRLKVGKTSRNLELFGRKMRAMVAVEHAQTRGDIEVVRESTDGRRSTYTATMRSVPVRVPGIDEELWLCVFDSPEHKHPLVVLTTLPGRDAEQLGRVLAAYFARWAGEEVHRFAKQAFKLENVRTLTWKRTKNLVAAVAIAMGAMARIAHLPNATTLIAAFEHHAQRLLPALKPSQFWGYAIASGAAAILWRAQKILPLMPWLRPRPRPPDLQLALL